MGKFGYVVIIHASKQSLKCDPYVRVFIPCHSPQPYIYIIGDRSNILYKHIFLYWIEIVTNCKLMPITCNLPITYIIMYIQWKCSHVSKNTVYTLQKSQPPAIMRMMWALRRTTSTRQTALLEVLQPSFTLLIN